VDKPLENEEELKKAAAKTLAEHYYILKRNN